MKHEVQEMEVNSDLERFIDIATPTISINSKTTITTVRNFLIHPN